ncbi:MAG: hypothetical protein OEY44_01290 [Candidatus Peregrinibacteria bacterium]|nr:hypothetical protein [Candidatus Peregrinibacteria bacterium]
MRVEGEKAMRTIILACALAIVPLQALAQVDLGERTPASAPAASVAAALNPHHCEEVLGQYKHQVNRNTFITSFILGGIIGLLAYNPLKKLVRRKA